LRRHQLLTAGRRHLRWRRTQLRVAAAAAATAVTIRSYRCLSYRCRPDSLLKVGEEVHTCQRLFPRHCRRTPLSLQRNPGRPGRPVLRGNTVESLLKVGQEVQMCLCHRLCPRLCRRHCRNSVEPLLRGRPRLGGRCSSCGICHISNGLRQLQLQSRHALSNQLGTASGTLNAALSAHGNQCHTAHGASRKGHKKPTTRQKGHTA
jgi:hypothetical protein